MISGSDLPESWAHAELSQIGLWGSGGTPDRKNPHYYGGDIPWLKIGDLPDGQVSHSEVAITKSGLDNSSAKVVQPGTLLVAMYGSIGKLGIAQIECATNQAIAFCNVNEDLVGTLFVFHYLRLCRDELLALGQGGGQQNISQTILKAFPIPIAPLGEQQRIVEKIETLFARLDKGEEAVREVQKLLIRYRQSVLKSAVTGQLTADWRAKNRDFLEDQDQAMDLVFEARREGWEGRGKYKVPAPVDVEGLPSLPSEWLWSNMDALIVKGPQNGIYLPQSKYGSGSPIIRIDDFQIGWIRAAADLRKVAADANETELYGLSERDLVINRVNSVSHLGKAVLIGADYQGALFESNMMRLALSPHVDPEYVELYLTSEIGRSRLIANCKHAVNQASINQGDVKSTPVPLPPISEQREIVLQTKELLSKTEVLENWCETELKRSASLRQSILKDAFAGRLVPQDPSDEPASALLARIAEAKTSTKKARRKVQA